MEWLSKLKLLFSFNNKNKRKYIKVEWIDAELGVVPNTHVIKEDQRIGGFELTGWLPMYVPPMSIIRYNDDGSTETFVLMVSHNTHSNGDVRIRLLPEYDTGLLVDNSLKLGIIKPGKYRVMTDEHADMYRNFMIAESVVD